MKNLKYITVLLLTFTLWSCQEDQFADNYPNPSKIANTTIERQYTGMQVAGIDYIVPAYWNYFVVLRITLNPWTSLSVGSIHPINIYLDLRHRTLSGAITTIFWPSTGSSKRCGM